MIIYENAGDKYLEPEKVADGGTLYVKQTQESLQDTPEWVIVILILVLGILFFILFLILFWAKSQNGSKPTTIILEPRRRENKKKFVLRKVNDD